MVLSPENPLELGGALGRNEATGRGVMFTTLNILKQLGIPSEGTTVAIQGAGNVGSVSAKLLHEAGLKVVAISDVSGGIYNPDGLDIPAILSYLAADRRNLLKDFNGGWYHPHLQRGRFWSSRSPSWYRPLWKTRSMQETPGKIQAKLIVEAANGPTHL